MPNEFLTVNDIARQALPVLQNNLVMPALINIDYSDTFQERGDTIQVKRPSVFVADEFGVAINLQDLNPQAMLVTMNKIADVSVEVTAKQLALNIADFKAEVLEPAVVALAEKINADAHALYKFVPKYVGVAGVTPDSLDDFANARKTLNKSKVPMGMRRGLWDPDADAKFTVLDAIVNAEKSGTTATLREGSLGRIQGLDNYMSQAVKTHTAGGYTVLADVKATINLASNAIDPVTGYTYSSAVLTSTAGAAITKLEVGDIFSCNGVQYTVLEQTAAAVAGVVTAKVYPAVAANVVAKDVVFADVTARAHVANLAFHRDAFCYVSRPLAPASGADASTVNFGGLAIRVTIQYDINSKKTIMSLDTLYGLAAPYPELAVRILG